MLRGSDNADRPSKRGERKRSTSMKRSKKQQKKVDEFLGASPVPGSGAPSWCAGDSKYLDILQENKVTGKQGIYVRGDWLTKITEESMTRGCEPAFCFSLDGITGKRTPSGFRVEDTWVALPISVFKRRVIDKNAD